MIDEATDIAGVRIRRVAALPEALEGAVRTGPYSTARPGALLRIVPGTGRFLARDGEAIDYAPEPDADAQAVEAALCGAVLGALIHQRGELPLHATTLVSPDRTFALALAGHSGAGKSTTAYALIRRGWILLSDDLTRVTLEGGKAHAWPGRSRLRLVSDACEFFGLDPATLIPAPDWPGKYGLQLPRWPVPLPLLAMAGLERTWASFELRRATGAAAMRILAEHSYRGHYVDALGQRRRHFELIAAVARSTAVFGSAGRAGIDEVAASIARAAIRLTAESGRVNSAPDRT